MKYPTREQAQMLADEKCPEAAKYICQGCELEMWCAPGDDDNGIQISIECGKSFLAMHDELDAGTHDADIAVNAGVKLAGRLIRALDLIRRMALEFAPYTHESLVAEADAMVKEA